MYRLQFDGMLEAAVHGMVLCNANVLNLKQGEVYQVWQINIHSDGKDTVNAAFFAHMTGDVDRMVSLIGPVLMAMNHRMITVVAVTA